MASETDRHCGRSDVHGIFLVHMDTVCQWGMPCGLILIISLSGRFLFLLSGLPQHRRAAGDQAHNGMATNMASETDRHCGRSDHTAELY